MQSEADRKKMTAALLTAVICLAVEIMLVVALYSFYGSFLGAVVASALGFGPILLWLAQPLYRHIVRGNQ